MPDADLAPHADAIVVSPTVLRDLRRDRQRRRIAGIEWFEALYRAYLTGGIGLLIVLFLSSAVGDDQVTGSALADVRRLAPAAIGIAAALAVAVGLRSGSRGGPLALEKAEVRHVLLAPVDRRRALLSPALKQVRFAAFAGAVVGAIAGQLAARRLPGTLVPWAASGALAGALVGLLYVGAGYLACGLRLPRWLATVIAALLLAWAVADLAGPVPSPFAAIGHLAIWPLQKEWLAVVAIPVVIGLVVLGLSLLNRLSLESAERRTALVGQLRFAATVRDLRTVMVLRRQLVQEQHRTRPWFRLPRFPRQTIWRRDLHGILRFPVVRLLRMAALTAIAAGCLNIAYHDTAPAAVLAGLALYLVGLDAIEPLAQEIDQADRADSIPKERGVLLVRHLPASALLLFLYAIFGGAVGLRLQPHGHRAGHHRGRLAAGRCGRPGPARSSAWPARSRSPVRPTPTRCSRPRWPACGSCSAPSGPSSSASWAPCRCSGARSAESRGLAPLAGAIQGSMAVAVVVGLTAAWLRFREPAKVWWRSMLRESQQEQARRSAARGAR